MSDFVFVLAVSSPHSPHASTLRAFNVRQICSEQCIQELAVEDTQPMKVCHIACQGKFLLLLTSTSVLHVFSIAAACSLRHSLSDIVDRSDSHVVLLPLQSTLRLALSPSSGIPVSLFPILLSSQQSCAQDDAAEVFGCAKGDESDESEESEDLASVSEEEELRSVVVINHDHTVDLVSLADGERKQLSDDALCVFLLKPSAHAPSFLQSSLVLFGKHRYNVGTGSSADA